MDYLHKGLTRDSLKKKHETGRQTRLLQKGGGVFLVGCVCVAMAVLQALDVQIGLQEEEEKEESWCQIFFDRLQKKVVLLAHSRAPIQVLLSLLLFFGFDWWGKTLFVIEVEGRKRGEKTTMAEQPTLASSLKNNEASASLVMTL